MKSIYEMLINDEVFLNASVENKKEIINYLINEMLDKKLSSKGIYSNGLIISQKIYSLSDNSEREPVIFKSLFLNLIKLMSVIQEEPIKVIRSENGVIAFEDKFNSQCKRLNSFPICSFVLKNGKYTIKSIEYYSKAESKYLLASLIDTFNTSFLKEEEKKLRR